MVSVFLSHSSKDKPFVRELADFLRQNGDIRVWFDENEIVPGENIISKIDEGLHADYILLILSPDMVESRWAKEEWTAAYWDQVNNGAVKVIPVLYRDCHIPRLLANKWTFDLSTNQLEGFRRIRAWLLEQRLTPSKVNLLPSRPPIFVGREEELKDLRRRLADPGAIAHIPGLPGKGKTTLALEFAHRYQADFESVYWLSCESRSLTLIVGELQRKFGLSIEGDFQRVLAELKDHCARKNCLLILDSVEDEEPGQLIPGGVARVLVTTRYPYLQFLRRRPPVELGLFNEDQCFELFRTLLGAADVEAHRAECQRIFEKLGYLPIAIDVTAALIRADVRYSIASVAAHPPSDCTQLLRDAIAALDAEPKHLLGAMAACAPQGFPLDLAAEIADLGPAASLDALQQLRSRSLVDDVDRNRNRFRLHALVRDSAADPANPPKHFAAVSRRYANWQAHWAECLDLLPNFQTAFEWSLIQPANTRAENVLAALASSAFALTLKTGNLPEAFEICARMAARAESRNDLGHVGAWTGNQALILADWGRLDEAMDLHKKEEAICLELGDRAGLQASYGNQALILQDWGRLDEAMALLKKQEAICLDLGDRAALQASYGNQALILKTWGRLDDAMDLHKKKEAICLELGDRAGLQRSYGNQALILNAWGRLDEAMDLLKKEEAICLELGDRAALGRSYGNQALILQDWGRLDEAMALHKKEEAICLELGDRAGLQASYGNQALILKAWGRLDEAMALLKKREAICLELGDRAALGRSYGNQALILKAWGRLDEAMDLHKKHEAICLELGDRAALGRSYGNQALILQDWGRLEEAMALLKKQEAICLDLGDRAALQASYGNQALILNAWGRLDEAMELHKKKEAICLHLGDPAGRASSLANMAAILFDKGDLGAARALAKDALSTFENLKMPAETEWVRQILKSLGDSDAPTV